MSIADSRASQISRWCSAVFCSEIWSEPCRALPFMFHATKGWSSDVMPRRVAALGSSVIRSLAVL